MKKKYILGVLLCLIVAVICLIKFLPEKAPEKVPEVKTEIKSEPGEEAKPYESPINFTKLQKGNADIYAWLTIPGTNVDYPVLQSPEDDTLYLDHNDKKEKDANGALFTEHVYNSNDFSDPVTVIYGHHMRSGAMFGNLQQDYTDKFDDLTEIIVYLPDRELHYEVFAAVPYSNLHILYHFHEFDTPDMMTAFIDDVKMTHAIGATVKSDVTVGEGDQLIVLSTCLQGNNTNRFLVIGKCVEEIS